MKEEKEEVIMTDGNDAEANSDGMILLDEIIPDIGRGKPFPTYLFATMKATEIESIPNNIDGFQLYKINTTDKDWTKVTSDRQYFDMKTSSRQNFFGTRKGGICQGSWVCPNPSCAFRDTSKSNQPNHVNWRGVRGQHNVKICQICDFVAVQETCNARKLVEYNPATNIATVYHIGKHSCFMKIDTRGKKEEIRKRFDMYSSQNSVPISTCSSKQLGIKNVKKLIDEGRFDEAQAEAHVWVDRRLTQRVRCEIDHQYRRDLNSFDAVGIMKRGADNKDPYYIYRISNGLHNNSSDYVFKSSQKMAQLAVQMDIDGPPHIFQNENAYFDTTHSHVYRFKSIALWLHHPPLAKLIRLANMEIRSENTNDITIFFELFNEILQKEMKNPEYKFNPRTFVCDESGANYNAIRNVFGETVANNRVKGCQWHFKNQAKKREGGMPEDVKENFKKTCEELCTATTVAKYNILKN